MTIKNHRMVGQSYKKARTVGSVITPTIIVCHDTASRLTPFSAMNYLRNNKRKVSVHFTVERDGTITQSVPTNRRANHAGRSTYHGRSHCNNFSIGIEIVNPGIMQAGKSGHARAWYGKEFDIAEYGIQKISTKEHGSGYWMPYTEEQIAAVIDICDSCVDKYNSIIDVTTHWYISPGRKVDTNPLFPLSHVKALAFGREDPADEEAESKANPRSDDKMVRIRADSGLNMRRWPSFNPNVILSIPGGTEVPVLSEGVFDGRDWMKVSYAGHEGWIVARYTE